MTVEEFRAHKYLPQQWRKELETNGILQLVLQVMEENHPARYAIAGDKDGDISPTRATLELGLTRGYSKYGDNLRLLAQQKIRSLDIGEPTYEKEQQEELTHG